jgi:hypothetical protein
MRLVEKSIKQFLGAPTYLTDRLSLLSPVVGAPLLSLIIGG